MASGLLTEKDERLVIFGRRRARNFVKILIARRRRNRQMERLGECLPARDGLHVEVLESLKDARLVGPGDIIEECS